ncbi:MAG: hypothetical protein D6748_05535 [Calditrichaeota bacterium]|nr:MAG: hypothetical protein D6748_05535 [Calditrichota bacterium]
MIQFAVTNELISQPIIHGLKTSGLLKDISLQEGSTAQNCANLVQKKIDLALISPLDYARNSSELVIVPDIAIWSAEATRYALVFFQSNLHSFHRIASQYGESQYQVLASLLFKEFYEIEVEWENISWDGSLDEILEKFPACLLEGDKAIESYYQSDSYLDIVEDYCEKTDSRYIHLLIAFHRDHVDHQVMESLLLSLQIGLRNLMNIAKDYHPGGSVSWNIYFEILSELFAFQSVSGLWDEMKSYLEYLFYHGYVDYIPELHFV